MTSHERTVPVPRRWTLHGLNSGGIFTLTYHGVRRLPRRVSYAIGHVGSWIGWRRMDEANAAIADNLRAIFPDEPEAVLRRRALDVYRSYTRDAIDFLRAIDADARDARVMFDLSDENRARAMALHALGRGIILVTGHHGNWEAGSLLMTRLLGLPLTVVAMRESSDTVNRIRREIRDRVGVQTIEVRQSLDTPLQIRAALAQNRYVAMLVDRHVGRDRVAVQLLGRRTWFLRAPFLMAALTGAPVVPCFIQRMGPGRFKARLGQEVMIPADAPRDAWMASAAQFVAAQLEAEIRARPECWYHFYRYWDAQRDEYAGLD
ncbi:MAG TPA: lysophospholipid acyltransferase family protein [Vicinamibacterales bacterium]|nr:lysophospholipid acyltransferase family protein [Vicinamibacterales bacterium]